MTDLTKKEDVKVVYSDGVTDDSDASQHFCDGGKVIEVLLNDINVDWWHIYDSNSREIVMKRGCFGDKG